MHPPDSFHPELETNNRKILFLELCRDEIDNYEEYKEWKEKKNPTLLDKMSNLKNSVRTCGRKQQAKRNI